MGPYKVCVRQLREEGAKAGEDDSVYIYVTRPNVMDQVQFNHSRIFMTSFHFIYRPCVFSMFFFVSSLERVECINTTTHGNGEDSSFSFFF